MCLSAVRVCVRVFEASAMATVFSDMWLMGKADGKPMLARSESQQVRRYTETLLQPFQNQADAVLSGHVGYICSATLSSSNWTDFFFFFLKKKKTKFPDVALMELKEEFEEGF